MSDRNDLLLGHHHTRSLMNHTLTELLDAVLIQRIEVEDDTNEPTARAVAHVRLNGDRCAAPWGDWLAAVKQRAGRQWSPGGTF